MVAERDGADKSADTCESLFCRTYDWSATAASTATITALATLEEVDPVELSDVLDITLYDHVDPEALDTLVAGEERVDLSFLIDDYRVRIDGEELTITRQCGR
ncbi:HalOD1 output domain-containing protein [Natronorubrum halophilum]|uniref:HalOD1 output domain-containing protein n=1 Tax=Natronorubrum halophilum TaxID=1702106 RepID=UPI0010C18917|nr:HalOD1 output domain-containing protein [Natronorubrum halophilum]